VVLMAITVPSAFTLIQEASIVSVQREVMSALYIGRSSAIANSAQRRVVFTPPQLIQITNQAGTTTYYSRSLHRYGSGIKISGNGTITVPYDARGLLSPSTTVTLTVVNGNQQSTTITVYPTGKATIG